MFNLQIEHLVNFDRQLNPQLNRKFRSSDRRSIMFADLNLKGNCYFGNVNSALEIG